MRATPILLTPLMSWVLLLSSCTTPPKPPAVDESQKRPVNSQTAVDLQTCKNELHNSRIQLNEVTRAAETTAVALSHLTMRQQLLATMQAADKPQSEANLLFTVHFDFGSSRVVMPSDLEALLVQEAKRAPLVQVRGRTD